MSKFSTRSLCFFVLGFCAVAAPHTASAQTLADSCTRQEMGQLQQFEAASQRDTALATRLALQLKLSQACQVAYNADVKRRFGGGRPQESTGVCNDRQMKAAIARNGANDYRVLTDCHKFAR